MKTVFLFYLLLTFSIFGCTKKHKVAVLPTKDQAQISKSLSESEPKQHERQKPLKLKENNFKDKHDAPHLSAIIKAENESALSFQVPGIIKTLNFKSGDFVKKDETLAILDDTSAALELKKTQIDLENKKLFFQQSQKNYQRYLTLFKKEIISQSALEENEQEYRLSKLNFAAAQTQLKIKEFEYELTKLKAPFDGTLTKSYKSLGDYTTIGSSVFDFVQKNDAMVFAQIPVGFFGKITTGMTLQIVNPISEEQSTMLVNKLVPVVDVQSHTFDIYGKIQNSFHSFIPGMYVEIILD